jgi:hypothetical protein
MSDVTRVFIVGFPRSGTTLVQSLLAAHPEVTSVPETFFFTRFESTFRLHRFVSSSRPAMRRQLETVAAVDRRLAPAPDRARMPDALMPFLSRRFISALDDLAAYEGSAAWVEKTPSHLHKIAEIEASVETPRFVHVIRSGLAAVASLYAVTMEHPEDWGRRMTLDECVERWNHDISISQFHARDPGHIFVRYEELAAAPNESAAAMARNLGLRADADAVGAMLSDYSSQARSVIGAEPWKQGVAGAIANRNSARADALFDDRRRIEILDRVKVGESALADLPLLNQRDPRRIPIDETGTSTTDS